MKLDVAQQGALRFYAWAAWFGAVAWFVIQLAEYSATHGGTDQSLFFLNTFAVIALAPKGVQGLLFAARYRSGSNRNVQPAKGIRLALYGAIWWLSLVAGIYGLLA